LARTNPPLPSPLALLQIQDITFLQLVKLTKQSVTEEPTSPTQVKGNVWTQIQVTMSRIKEQQIKPNVRSVPISHLPANGHA
jgi:hypothetical protein